MIPVVALPGGQSATLETWSAIVGEPWQVVGVYSTSNPPPAGGIVLPTSATPGHRFHRLRYTDACGQPRGESRDEWEITQWGFNTGDCPPRPPATGGASANPPAEFRVFGDVPFDCTKPTALIVHGWMSGPDAAWIRCLAEEVQGRGQNGYNVLIADASRYMSATEAIFNSGAIAQAALDATEGAVRGGLGGAALQATLGLALEALIGPRNNIDRAGVELAQSARCWVPNACSSRPPIDLIVGHSFGGAIGAKIASEIQRSGGPLAPPPVPTLVTIDTPWTMLGAREIDLRAYADMAARSTVRHVNYFSTCLWDGGVGSALPTGPTSNVVNYLANAAGRNQTTQCDSIAHTCLASRACALIDVSLDGLRQAAPGTYQQGPTPFSYELGGTPECLGSTSTNFFAQGFDSLGQSIQLLFGVGTSYDAPSDVRTLQVIPGEGWALATGPFIVPAQAGHLYFQYRRVGMPPDQEASVEIDGDPRWSTLGPEPTAPPEDWQTAMVPLVDRAGTTSTLSLQLTPPSSIPAGGGTQPTGGTIEFRALKIVPLAGVACTAAPAITQQPSVSSNCRVTVLSVGTTGTLGTSYFWRRNGQDLRDGAMPGGTTVTGSRGPILLLTGVTAADAGSFDVVVRNACGATTSTPVNVVRPCTNRGDIAGRDQSIGCDGFFTADDIIVFLAWFFASDSRADFAGPNQSTTPDGNFTADDIIVFLGLYFAGC